METMKIDPKKAEWAHHIQDAFIRRQSLSNDEIKALRPHIDAGMAALDSGILRSARCIDGEWQVDDLANKVILLAFMSKENLVLKVGDDFPTYYDKFPLKFAHWTDLDFKNAAIRIVPGAIVRYGAYIGRSTVAMPCFINVGAYVGEGSMVDTWATIGSCAQVGARCHISGGVGLGGVLEPLGSQPVIIEDDVFIGARSEIAEGVRVCAGAVLAMGVFISKSTPIIDRNSGEVFYGEVPENAVVVSGSREDNRYHGISTAAAIIVKYADESTRGKTALNNLVREG